MAEVNHRYIGRIPSEGEQERQAKRDRLDAEWKQKRIAAESARQRLHEAKLLAMKGELISRRHVQKQAAFLVLSLRARLLALSTMHARELLNVSDEREMTLADLPLKVTDEHWMQKLDGEWTPSVKEATIKSKTQKSRVTAMRK